MVFSTGWENDALLNVGWQCASAVPFKGTSHDGGIRWDMKHGCDPQISPNLPSFGCWVVVSRAPNGDYREIVAGAAAGSETG